MKVAETDDVETEGAHGGQILGRGVERATGAESLGESQMEVVDERLVAGDRFEPVAMGEGERRLPCSIRAAGAHQKITAMRCHVPGGAL